MSRIPWFALLLMLALPVLAQPPVADAKAARAAAVTDTLVAIDAEVAAHGGAWEAWATALQPFRDDVRRITAANKWPWPARQNFVFQGKEVDLAMLDNTGAQPANQRPLEAIVYLDRQLKARGIDLIFMPIPDKLSTYPDYLSDKAPEDRMVALASKRLLRDLSAQGVEVVDLFTRYRDQRRADETRPLYYVQDSHWRNRGAQIAGEALAARLQRYDFVQHAMAKPNPYTTSILERTDGVKADTVLQMLDAATKQPYRNVGQSPILVTGDSFAMYNEQNGGMVTAHLARGIGLPVSLMCKEGLSANMPVELAAAAKRGMLEGRRVVIWTVGGRFLARMDWPRVLLPNTQAANADVRDVVATGTVMEMSQPPAKDALYPNYVMKFYLKDLRDPVGNPIGRGDGVVHLQALQDRVVREAVTAIKPGQVLTVTLTAWELVEAKYGAIMNGILPTVETEVEVAHYWGELR